MIEITILGCGGSDGVPQIGCSCSVCTSKNSKNHRTRASILVKVDDFHILIDAGPDLHQQAIREGMNAIDAVLLTHAHYDHIAGIGDIKRLMKDDVPTSLFADPDTITVVESNFKYAFFSKSKLYPAIINGHSFHGSFSIIGCGLPIIPFKQRHGKVYSYGFRIGDFAYSTDVNGLDDNAYKMLKTVKLWVVDCLRYYHSPTHFALDDTIAAILQVNPDEAIITHMSHTIDYSLLSEVLPARVKLAYDGMKITI